MYRIIEKELISLADPKKAVLLSRFFKTGKGEYGEGDRFIGIIVPKQRQVSQKYYKDVSFEDIKKLLKSPIHEYRLTSLLILVSRFNKADEKQKKLLFDLYLTHTDYINNWDLVDLSSPQIVGAYLFDKDKTILYKLARSKSLWEKRIAVLATFWFIRNKTYADAVQIAEMLLDDKHDLIHKAVGWMLREIGKRDKKTEIDFLNKFSQKMPRTMLRYAIEKFDKEERVFYLKK